MSSRSWFLVLWLLPSAALARGAGEVGSRQPLLSAQECSALFGSGAVRAGNAQRRGLLYWVDQESGGVTVAHRSDEWDEPVPIRVRGLRLDAARAGLAVVTLAAEGASALGCRQGRYRVGVDDNLTRAVRVLAVLDGVVLLEHRRRLVYLLAPGARDPRWLMAWSAPGLIKVEGGAQLGADSIESPYQPPYRSLPRVLRRR